ncbi:hypothetical protein HZC32_02255, partial [Candidatus Woesearchaeota archaeon]|nr:hypothetical protein [Candidatus Woesearchaeota archaeon]
QVAEITNNAQLCEKINDDYWADNCYFHLSRNNNQSDTCMRIGNKAQKEECFQEIALATSNPKLCPLVAENYTQWCVYKIATNSKDAEICTQLSNSINKNSCILRIAKLTNDKALCEKITISFMKQLCIDYFSGNKTIENNNTTDLLENGTIITEL